jgi:hypothetical protein
MENLITHEEITRLLDYDPESGIFTWKTSGGSRKIGRIAGSLHKSGKWQLMLNKKNYWAHRLAWFYVYKKWPTNVIDHINGDGIDNSINNLRDCTETQNQYNRKLNKNSKTGYKGVTISGNKFIAKISVGDREKWLGTFDTAEEASETYKSFAKQLHGEYFRDV